MQQAIAKPTLREKAPRNKRNQGKKHSAEMAKRERNAQNKLISKKKAALEAALKCPPAIYQFKTKINDEIKQKLTPILKRYKPETKEEKAARLSNPEAAPKREHTLRMGINEIVKLIQRKKLSLVLIANNVDPIVVVLYLPSLCKKMGISYAIYDTKEELGAIVGRNSIACLGVPLDVPGVEPLLPEIDEQFSNRYEEAMRTWGKPAEKANK